MTTPRLLSERYELGDTLGYGGMSEVHKGRDVRLSRDVAIKVLRADLARDPQFQLRFRREAQNAAALNHPAIVAVYDTGETESEFGSLPYIVMEFVDGQTLREIVTDAIRYWEVRRIGYNAVLAAIKLAAGLVGHTYALVADAVESAADVFASLLVWIQWRQFATSE